VLTRHWSGWRQEATVLKLTEADALSALRKTLALEKSLGTAGASSSSMAAGAGAAAVPVLSDEQRAAYERLVQKRSATLKKSATVSDKAKMYSRVGRLRLDDALRQLSAAPATEADLARAMEGWSEARIRAYKLIQQNPNAYYYRFNAPGEQQRNGRFTPVRHPPSRHLEGSLSQCACCFVFMCMCPHVCVYAGGQAEHKLFMDRLREVGADGQWGIFSMSIPGRVGYQVGRMPVPPRSSSLHGRSPARPTHPPTQCSNYYRQLLERGQVRDPNYYIDDKGKAHYLFSTKKDADGNPIERPPRKRKGGDADNGDDGDDDDDGGAGSARKRRRSTGARRGRERGGYGDDDEDEADAGDDWDLDNLDPERIQAEQARYQSARWKTTKRTRALLGEAADDDEEESLRQSNPLPGHVDPITLEPVVKPAISPYGHVMRCAQAHDGWRIETGSWSCGCGPPGRSGRGYRPWSMRVAGYGT
jgi:hypothetical protein